MGRRSGAEGGGRRMEVAKREEPLAAGSSLSCSTKSLCKAG